MGVRNCQRVIHPHVEIVGRAGNSRGPPAPMLAIFKFAEYPAWYGTAAPWYSMVWYDSGVKAHQWAGHVRLGSRR